MVVVLFFCRFALALCLLNKLLLDYENVLEDAHNDASVFEFGEESFDLGFAYEHGEALPRNSVFFYCSLFRVLFNA